MLHIKKVTILVLLSLCVLSVRAQNRFRAAVIEPAAPTAETGLVRHPWTGKKVLFIGDSISDCVAALFYKNTDKDRLHPNEAGHRRLAEVLLYQSLVLPCRVI